MGLTGFNRARRAKALPQEGGQYHRDPETDEVVAEGATTASSETDEVVAAKPKRSRKAAEQEA